MPRPTLNDSCMDCHDGSLNKPSQDHQPLAGLDPAIHPQAIEARLRDGEVIPRTVLESSFDGYFLVDAAGRFLDVNQAYATLTGYSREELLQLGLQDLATPPSPDHPARSVLPAGCDSPDRFEQRHRRKDGQLVDVEVSAKCLPGGDGRVFAFLRDITHRRQLESERNARLESEASYRGLFNTIRLPIYIQDAEGRFIDVNDGALEMYGYSREDLLGRTPEFLAAPGRNDLASVAERIHRALAGKPQQFEFWGRRKNGETFPTDVHLRRCTCFGQVTLLAVADDVTTARRVEEHLRQAHKMEAVGQLVGGIAHDFNNILAAMKLQIELLQMNLCGDPKNLAEVRDLADTADRAATLTRQLLLFIRRSVLQAHEIQLNEVVGDLTRMLLRLLGGDIELTFEAAPGVPRIRADPGMIHQVLLNLAVNARDAMPHGGRLEVRTAPATFDADAVSANPNARPGRFACLAVRDTGCGMQPALLDRIFEPFFTSKQPGKGTGLGLSIVHNIVHQHGGWIDVESTPGHGTTFRVFLPACATPAPSTSPPEPKPTPGGTETLLLVEDNDCLRRNLSAYLGHLGYTILEAADGPSALSVSEQHRARIALLLTVMVMPGGINGLELTDQIRRQRPALQVILSSGHSPDLAEGEAAKRGLVLLPKPYPPTELATTLRRCLDAPAAP